MIKTPILNIFNFFNVFMLVEDTDVICIQIGAFVWQWLGKIIYI